ncbi:hypothetical protein GCM10010303_16770 [Streptomyces purpurascens]|nr:hypothetical protein GCM10010303_16770 [Streptomyces purpurascens]
MPLLMPPHQHELPEPFLVHDTLRLTRVNNLTAPIIAAAPHARKSGRDRFPRDHPPTRSSDITSIPVRPPMGAHSVRPPAAHRGRVRIGEEP